MAQLRSATSLPTPGDILNPVGWLRADLGHGVADAASVPSWANQGSGGSGLDVANATGSQQCTYDEANATFNGQPVMDFAATQRMYSGITDLWELADGEDLFVLVVFSVDSTATHYTVATDGSAGFLRFGARSGGASVQAIEDSDGFATSISGSSLSTGTAYVHSTTLDNQVSAASDTHSLFLDGVADGTDTEDLLTVEPAGGSGNEQFIVGSWRIISGVLLGKIAEIIIDTAVPTSGEEADLVAYLDDRYGFSLPGLV